MSQESLDPNEELMLITDIADVFRLHVNDSAVIQDYSHLEQPTIMVLGGEWRRDKDNYYWRTTVSIWKSMAPSKKSEGDFIEVMLIKIGSDSYSITPNESANVSLKKPMTNEELSRIRFIVRNPDVTWSRNASEALAANSDSQSQTNI